MSNVKQLYTYCYYLVLDFSIEYSASGSLQGICTSSLVIVIGKFFDFLGNLMRHHLMAASHI